MSDDVLQNFLIRMYQENEFSTSNSYFSRSDPEDFRFVSFSRVLFLRNGKSFTYVLQQFFSIQELTLVPFFYGDNLRETYVTGSNI